MEGRLDLLVRKAFEHHTHHAQVDPGLAGDRHEFVVLAHLPVAPEEGEIDAGTLALTISCTAGEGIHEDLNVTNYGLIPAHFTEPGAMV